MQKDKPPPKVYKNEAAQKLKGNLLKNAALQMKPQVWRVWFDIL